MGKVCVGVDIGGTTIKLGLFSEEGEPVRKWEIPTRTEEAGSHILEDVAKSSREAWEGLGKTEADVLGIGIGVPGPVVEERRVLQCVNLGWGEFDVAEELARLTGVLNVKVGNDANVAALGEMWKGGGKGFQSIVMITLGTGVGGGVILNGRILTGSNGAAGEIGHLTVNPDEPDACNCGKRGCLEQYVSATGIVKETRRALAATDRPSSLRKRPSLSAKAVFDAAKEGDALALEVVDGVGRRLGVSLGNVAQVLDPEAFVIGGGVSKAGSILTDAIGRYYDQSVMKALRGKKLCLATLGNDAGIYGSAKLVLGDR